MTSRPRDATVRLWVSLMRAQRTVLDRVEGALKAAGLPPLGWYDVLLEVERAGEPGIRLLALEKALLLPQYGISRLIKRLEQEGLLARLAIAGDRRGVAVQITDAGRSLRRRMWPVYAAALEEAVGRHVSEEEAARAAAVLSALVPKDAP